MTRWSARHDACRAVNESKEVIFKSLDKIASDCDERHSTRNEARTISEKLSSLETTIMAALWGSILERFNKVNVKLQYEITELGKIVAYYDSLCGFLQKVRNNFDDLERSANEKCRKEYMANIRRKRKVPTKFGEYGGPSSDDQFTGSENFRVNTFNAYWTPYTLKIRNASVNILIFTIGLILLKLSKVLRHLISPNVQENYRVHIMKILSLLLWTSVYM
ncbi:unnamed protein product [Psylliodes chrysocephalus]|uniref:Uncharacterized protein n=1 Tax=Psylliodes chrysocephalus TaxID=3402493 RepID=A0A9P0G796_9CUCU|nr:unnamed protein product [Psylliodes chrysocephala]